MLFGPLAQRDGSDLVLRGRLFSALRLQHRSEPGSPSARGRDLGSSAVAEPHAVKAVAVMSDVFDSVQIHCGMPADLDKRIAA